MANVNPDNQIRLAAFDWLSRQIRLHGDVLSRKLLEEGFVFQGEQVTLIGASGIWKPRVLPEIPLSITTTSSGPYEDSFRPDELLEYKYRGTDPMHRDNVGLRKAMQQRIPLIYFQSEVPGKYAAAWPVYIVGDDPANLTFTVAVDDYAYVKIQPELSQQRFNDAEWIGRRAHVTRMVRARLGQQGFRVRVIDAYQEQCACCRLRHVELLDAAHIVPHSDPKSEMAVKNGISLCKLHHAAFDSYLFGIRPDHVIEVREDVRREKDGPMLIHGLQQIHDQKIAAPRSIGLAPDPNLLEQRYEIFRSARL